MSVYGDTLNSTDLEEFLSYIFESNLRIESDLSQRPTPICIWGKHGLGKTAGMDVLVNWGPSTHTHSS